MAGGGNPGASGGGSGGNKKLSYQGGSVPDTFDTKTFGTTLMSDASKTYQQGPKVNPYSSYVPYTPETKGLIGQGLQNNTDLRASNIGNIAKGGVNIGPDYTTGIMGDVAAGKYLGGGNPYLNQYINQTNDQVSQDVNSTFASNGTFGSDVHAKGLSEGLANADNTARFNQYNTDFANMTGALGAQGQQANNNLAQEYAAQNQIGASTAQAAGYSSLLDQKAQEKRLSQQQQWDAKHNANYNNIAKYFNLINGAGTDPTNKPANIWDYINAAGSTAAAFL
jgi:hypothetical protein